MTAFISETGTYIYSNFRPEEGTATSDESLTILNLSDSELVKAMDTSERGINNHNIKCHILLPQQHILEIKNNKGKLKDKVKSTGKHAQSHSLTYIDNRSF